MKNTHARITTVALGLLLLVTSHLALAGKPLPTSSHAFGEGYPELTADWLEVGAFDTRDGESAQRSRR